MQSVLVHFGLQFLLFVAADTKCFLQCALHVKAESNLDKDQASIRDMRLHLHPLTFTQRYQSVNAVKVLLQG